MTIIEYQLTEREFFYAHAWRITKRPRFIILSLILLVVGIAYIFIFNNRGFGTAYVIMILTLITIPINELHRQVKSDPMVTSRIRLAFGDMGIITTIGGVRSERTWQSLTSWSQSKNHIFLHLNTLGAATAIPKRAFTSEQLVEFLELLKKIYSHPLSPQAQKRAQAMLKQKDKIADKVFLSYAREDVEAARHLFNDLRNAGIDVWLDTKSLLPGQNWKAAISQAIRESRFFLALLSSNSVSKKGYVQKELKHALEILDEYPDTKIFLIPVRLDNCNPSSEKLQELHWIDIYDNWEEGLARIFNTIQSQSTSNNDSK
jgi:hypothetical protein